MKAIVIEKYGSADVLELRDIDKPVAEPDEVLIRVHAASVNPADWHFMTGLPYIGRPVFGLTRPKVTGIGADLAGLVEAVGEEVTQFRPGDEVYGQVNGETPGHPILYLGACAEYVCVSESVLAHKPANLTHAQAAAMPMAAVTALQGLRDHGETQPGQRVLINGASGGVGTFAVQIGKALGAEVTGVCSTRNGDMVRSIGADHVVDYTRQDFTRDEARYDLIFDLVGNHAPSACRRVLDPKGTYLASYGRPENRWLGPATQLIAMGVMNPFVGQRMTTFTAKRTKQDLLDLKELVEAGKVTPVIDQTYPLEETAAAMRHLEEGHARGKVVITV